jgi:hypothetical protein
MLCANCSCAFHNLISKIGKVNPYVLVAITITSRIQHPVGFNANRVTAYSGWRRTGESVFRHKR